MAGRATAANSLLLKRGFDRRKLEELLKAFKEADTNQVICFYFTYPTLSTYKTQTKFFPGTNP